MDANQVSTQSFNYDQYNNVTDIYEYGYGLGSAGALVRRRHTDYLTTNPVNSQDYTAAPVHIRALPSQEQVFDGSGLEVRRTTYEYDNYSPGGSHAVLVARSGISSLDSTYANTSYAPRGNVTQIGRWLLPAGTPLFAYQQFDVAGNSVVKIDEMNRATTFDFVDRYGAPGAEARSNTPPIELSGQTSFAFPTLITNPAGHKIYIQYDYYLGKIVAEEDPNGVVSNASYGDPLDRPTQVVHAVNSTIKAQSSFSYNNSTHVISTATDVSSYGDGLLRRSITYDGLGRTIQEQLNSDPDCPSGDKTDTTYDALSRVYTVSNPYCTGGESTSGLTTYSYDALGRTTQVMKPDNSTVLMTYTGRATQVQDEGNGNGTTRVTRISQTDALGRLVSVCEVSSGSLIGSGGTPAACGQDIAGTGFLTTYQYDALDNLTSVSMSGLNPRTFAYDSLSRLTSATNPESGQICYGTVSAGICQANGYDANGNLVTKTDARGIITTQSYDALNRLTGKTYSDDTPAAIFNYDQSSALGVTLTNTVGRKSSESTAGSNATGSVFSYDTMGRISNNSQCTPQNCGSATNPVFALQYTQYDFLGDLTSATNAAGVTFTYAYNTAGRLTGITTNFIDPSHPGTLLSNAHYNPFGFLTGATLGNGVTESWSYNNRGWQKTRTVTFGATTPYSFNVATFAPDGDVLAANDSANGNWVYAYDAFNRLTCSNLASNGTCATPTSGTSTYTYDYDRFGNRWHQNGPQSSQLGFDANNRITGVTGVGYDNAGNLTSDGAGPGSHMYFYDAENRIIQVDGTLGTCSAATACYVYNAEGQRVRKTTGGSSMDYLYDLAGNKVADVDPTGVFMQGELYAGDRHFAIYGQSPDPTGATFFTHSDWLGTERVRTDMTGTNCESIASLPFGDGQSMTGTCGDVSPMHFTGKERDSESGLDNFGARYNSSSMGRFMSPAPYNAGAFLDGPQTWNAYSYVVNNPLNAIDPTGLDCVYLAGASDNPDPHGNGSATVVKGDCINAGGRKIAAFLLTMMRTILSKVPMCTLATTVA